jgi:hypothetical protein
MGICCCRESKTKQSSPTAVSGSHFNDPLMPRDHDDPLEPSLSASQLSAAFRAPPTSEILFHPNASKLNSAYDPPPELLPAPPPFPLSNTSKFATPPPVQVCDSHGAPVLPSPEFTPPSLPKSSKILLIAEPTRALPKRPNQKKSLNYRNSED